MKFKLVPFVFAVFTGFYALGSLYENSLMNEVLANTPPNGVARKLEFKTILSVSDSKYNHDKPLLALASDKKSYSSMMKMFGNKNTAVTPDFDNESVLFIFSGRRPIDYYIKVKSLDLVMLQDVNLEQARTLSTSVVGVVAEFHPPTPQVTQQTKQEKVRLGSPAIVVVFKKTKEIDAATNFQLLGVEYTYSVETAVKIYNTNKDSGVYVQFNGAGVTEARLKDINKIFSTQVSSATFSKNAKGDTTVSTCVLQSTESIPIQIIESFLRDLLEVDYAYITTVDPGDVEG